jgi:ankyrin repeat protein
MFHVSTTVPQFSDLQPCSIWTSLLNSTGTGDEALVENLCIEAKNYPGKPMGIVFKAISKGHISSAWILLRYFSDLEDLKEPEVISDKLLEILAVAGDIKLLQKILDLCPSLPWYSWQFNSALTKACTIGQTDMCIFLLEQMRLRGFKILDSRLTKSAVSAAQFGHSNNSSIMLDAICKVTEATYLIATCTDLAAQGHISTLKQVLHHIFENFGDHVFKSRRFQNFEGLSIDEVASRLINDTVDRSKALGSSFRSSFQSAAFHGNTSKVSRMLELGIDINNVSGQHGTALQAASKKGNIYMVKWLLDRGAQIETEGGDFGNAMAGAAAMGNVEVLKVLLAASKIASPVARAIKKKKGGENAILPLPSHPIMATPLHFAAAELQEKAVHVLLEAGADITAVDSNGNTAFHLAILGPFSGNRKLFASRIQQSSCVICRLLLEHGARATAQNHGGNSPLHLLFINDQALNEAESWHVRQNSHPCAVQLTKMLFEAGANIYIPNKNNISAKDAAVMIGGQLLEDLKREIPTAWIDLDSSAGSHATRLSITSSETLSDSVVDSRIGFCLDQGSDLPKEDENRNSKTRQIPTAAWDTDNMSRETGVSYSSGDVMEGIAMTSTEHQGGNGTYEANNGSYQSCIAWNQQNKTSFQPSLELLTNPWATTQDAEKGRQIWEMEAEFSS